MAFKSYAEQGNFDKNLVKLPGKASKIQAAGQRKLQQMDRSQSLLERNQDMYLSGLKDAQGIEQQQREQNEKRRAEERQLYIDTLEADARLENEVRKREFEQQQKVLGDLVKFSATAIDAGSKFIEADQERKLQQANAIVHQTGLSYSDIRAFAAIDKTFTDQEAFSSDEGARILAKYGDTPEIRTFLSNARNDGARRYIENKVAIINETENLLPGILDNAIVELEKQNPYASYEERRAALTVAAGNFRRDFGIDARILEGIAGGKIREIESQYENILLANHRAVKAGERKQQRQNVLTAKLGANRDNAAEILDYVTTNPSYQKRVDVLDYLENGLKSGKIKAETVHAIISGPYLRDGKETTLEDQFAGSDEMVNIQNALIQDRVRQKQEWELEKAERMLQADNAIRQVWNDSVITDNVADRDEVYKLQAIAREMGHNLESLPIWEEIRYYTKDERSSFLAMQDIQKKALNNTLTEDDINKQTLTLDDRKIADQLLTQQNRLIETPEYKRRLNQIRELPYSRGNLAKELNVARTNKENLANHKEYIYELQDSFKRALKLFDGDTDQAYAYVVNEHEERTKNREAITASGALVHIEQKFQRDKGSYNNTVKEYKNTLVAVKSHLIRGDNEGFVKLFRQNETMYQDFEAAYANPTAFGIPEEIKLVAQEAGMLPAELMQDMGAAFGFGDYSKEAAEAFADLKTKLPKLDYHTLNTHRSEPLRTLRAFGVPAPGRGKFANDPRVTANKNVPLSQLNIAQIAVRAGFTKQEALTMAAIAYAESGGLPWRDTVESGLDPNKENEFSVGLFQINVQVHQDKLDKLGYTVEDMRDPYKNAEVAKMVYDEARAAGRDPFMPWTTYEHKKHIPYLKTLDF